MSYEPTNWKTGDVVTSAKLNKLENGVAGAGGVLIANFTYEADENGETYTLDKTWAELKAAWDAGVLCIIKGSILQNPSDDNPPEYHYRHNFMPIVTLEDNYANIDNRYIAYSRDANGYYLFVANTTTDPLVYYNQY